MTLWCGSESVQFSSCSVFNLNLIFPENTSLLSSRTFTCHRLYCIFTLVQEMNSSSTAAVHKSLLCVHVPPPPPHTLGSTCWFYVIIYVLHILWPHMGSYGPSRRTSAQQREGTSPGSDSNMQACLSRWQPWCVARPSVYVTYNVKCSPIERWEGLVNETWEEIDALIKASFWC